MPFIPHTEEEIRAMLEAIGVSSIGELFDEIPPTLRCGELAGLPPGMSEAAVARLMRERAEADRIELNFAGAGAYEHHIPAAVWQIATRGEFYSAYTPYQAEASQGTLQVIYEFQSMITALLGTEVANASLYDGASALAEAVLMAERAHRQPRGRVLVPRSVHPAYRKTLATILATHPIEIEELPFGHGSGRTLVEAVERAEPFTALVVPQPNFFGVLEESDRLTDAAHARGALVIALVNPLAMAILKPPGRWGARGADIVCGDGQPLGCPLSSGGPYYGFLSCRKELVRQMPGRIVGRTVDLEGRPGFTLTLQAREQHIRRAKANSNICTNQGLLVTASTIHMALLGPEGLARAARRSCHNARLAVRPAADAARREQDLRCALLPRVRARPAAAGERADRGAGAAAGGGRGRAGGGVPRARRRAARLRDRDQERARPRSAARAARRGALNAPRVGLAPRRARETRAAIDSSRARD
ncbi:MAG: aminomethyl-transferring glycine dehydrogenase subunit GcvPA [Xanthomonadales bacterium]|nr:aminomethyl-transferring glycine dehydrogenase subunit GcvPA [Xanthomonadales bacterium]